MDSDDQEPPRWTDSESKDVIQAIIRSCTSWKDGLTAEQLDLVATILEGGDVLYIAATGSGKSSAFSAPIIVLNEYSNNPGKYREGLRSVSFALGVVITPTKGLANNLVCVRYHCSNLS
jgi:superfamily II DNA/RNA helicase